MRWYYSAPALLLSVIVVFSCKSPDKKLVPDKDLVEILTDVYIADGLLSNPSIRTKFSAKDSVSNYIDIIEKHGYTKVRMDYTMRYYFDKNPKKLQNIYDRVLIRLNEEQALLEKETPVSDQPKFNIWPGKPSISVPESGVKDPVWFSVQVKDTGMYILDFYVLLFNDDESINPRATVFFWHTDSSKAGNRILWPEVPYPRDAQRHTYSIKQRLTDTTFNHIGGWLLNSDPKEGRWEKHALIENIVLHK